MLAFMAVAGIVIAIVDATDHHSRAAADTASLECQSISGSYATWIDATTNASVAQDFAATRLFLADVSSYRDAKAEALANKLTVLEGALAAQLPHPADQTGMATTVTDAQAMRTLADGYNSCP